MNSFAVSVDRLLGSVVESGALSGVVAAVACNGAEPYVGCFGAANASTAMSPETVFWIASMTKAVTAVAAMQLVERGAITLDEPLGGLVPYLASVQVLDGFDGKGAPRLRAPKRAITLRHLLTHTSGFGYDFADASLAQFTSSRPAQDPPSPAANYEFPLLFDPGERWCYGVGIDWCGQVIEGVTGQRLNAYFGSEIFGPLGMRDTTFTRSADQRERTAEVRLRTPDSLVPIPFELPDDPPFLMAGGGLYSTVTDYLRFARMLLGNGSLDGNRILSAHTVELMGQNHTGGLRVGGWQSANPMLTNDVDLTVGGPKAWGLSFLINAETTAEGRSAGSLAWAGLANTYYWIDRRRGTTGILATQVLPFYDEIALRTFHQLESAVNSL